MRRRRHSRQVARRDRESLHRARSEGDRVRRDREEAARPCESDGGRRETPALDPLRRHPAEDGDRKDPALPASPARALTLICSGEAMQKANGQKTLHPKGWKPASGYTNGIVATGQTIFVGGQI